MPRLCGEDAGFLHMDLPHQQMTTMSMGILRPATGADGAPQYLTLADLRAHMAARLGELPSFRWRVLPVPFGLNHPAGYDDPDFDLDYHLREITLPAPADDEALDLLMAQLAERPLDRRHPLWQIHLVHGLDGGRQAVITRFHHCLMDGVAALTTFSRVYSGVDHQVAVPPEPFDPPPLPKGTRRLVDGLRDQGPNLKRLPSLIARTKRNMAAVKARQLEAPVHVPVVVKDTTPCSLNDAFTPARRWTRVALSIDDLKAVKDAAGVTLNDVILGVMAGALRSYLLARDDLPERPLTCSVPVGYEPPDAPPRQWGNDFGSLTTSLATDVSDPWKRLAKISEVMAESRVQLDLLEASLMPEWLDAVPPFLTAPGVRAHNKARATKREEADVNVLVSNLRGPTERWMLGTALVEDLYLSGPCSNGVGNNVMVWSYGDRMLFGIRSFADALDSSRDLHDAMHVALAELVELARTTAE